MRSDGAAHGKRPCYVRDRLAALEVPCVPPGPLGCKPPRVGAGDMQEGSGEADRCQARSPFTQRELHLSPAGQRRWVCSCGQRAFDAILHLRSFTEVPVISRRLDGDAIK